MTEHYAGTTEGVCLGNWLPGGATVFVDPEAPIRSLDPVMIAFKADGRGPWASCVRAGHNPAMMVKLFLRRTGSALLFGQLNPPTVALIPVSEIEALHKVVAKVGGSSQPSDTDKAAFLLVAPFAGDQTIDPINPGWMPGQDDVRH